MYFRNYIIFVLVRIESNRIEWIWFGLNGLHGFELGMDFDSKITLIELKYI